MLELGTHYRKRKGTYCADRQGMRCEVLRRHSEGTSAPVFPRRVVWDRNSRNGLTFAKTGTGKQTGLLSLVKILMQTSVFTLVPFFMYGSGQIVMPR